MYINTYQHTEVFISREFLFLRFNLYLFASSYVNGFGRTLLPFKDVFVHFIMPLMRYGGTEIHSLLHS